MSVPFNIYSGSTPGGNLIYGTLWGAYFKPGGTPSGDTTLIDYYAGAVLYNRVRLTTGMHVVHDISYRGAAASLDLTGSLAIAAGTWYWVWGCVSRSYSTPFGIGISGGVIGPGGVGGGRQDYDNVPGGGGSDGTVSCQLGIGVSLSSGLNNFPSGSGWAMSKMYQLRWFGAGGGTMLGHGPVGAPASDNNFIDSGSQTTANGPLDFAYNARQTVGAATALTDATGNGYTGDGTGHGLQILASGPF